MTVPSILPLIELKLKADHFFQKGTLIIHPTHLREYTYFSLVRWYPVPFTAESFKKMPYQELLSVLVSAPLLKHFSLSVAMVLKKKERGV